MVAALMRSHDGVCMEEIVCYGGLGVMHDVPMDVDFNQSMMAKGGQWFHIRPTVVKGGRWWQTINTDIQYGH
jgi:hypothetical protein